MSRAGQELAVRSGERVRLSEVLREPERPLPPPRGPFGLLSDESLASDLRVLVGLTVAGLASMTLGVSLLAAWLQVG